MGLRHLGGVGPVCLDCKYTGGGEGGEGGWQGVCEWRLTIR